MRFLTVCSLLLFPLVGNWVGLSQHQFGLWSAIAIHDTSSVVGSALAYGEEALEVATTVKLSRVLWVIPLSLGSMLLFKGKNKRIRWPWFILLFVAAMCCNTWLQIPAEVAGFLSTGARRLLVLTLFLVGAGLSIERLKAAGWAPLALGASLWLLVSVVSLLAILWL